MVPWGMKHYVMITAHKALLHIWWPKVKEKCLLFRVSLLFNDPTAIHTLCLRPHFQPLLCIQVNFYSLCFQPCIPNSFLIYLYLYDKHTLLFFISSTTLLLLFYLRIFYICLCMELNKKLPCHILYIEMFWMS